MLTAIDHIIIGVNNLEQAATQFSQQLGLAVSGGGIHPTGGTANRIIVIGDTYLELIAIHNPAEAQQSMLDRLAIHEGYLNFVLASNDIEADSTALINRSILVHGPTSGLLMTDDGRARGWSRTNIERPDLAQRYQTIYGLQPSDSFTGEADGWDAMLVAFPLGGNDQGQCFELAEPLPLSAEADQD